ncbi:MAG TPA: hypothetical protein VJ812_05215 [Gemmatimonadaceae bacterium]|nr:hypothetical protein [Gemmatimonadaceae bacterium]
MNIAIAAPITSMPAPNASARAGVMANWRRHQGVMTRTGRH